MEQKRAELARAHRARLHSRFAREQRTRNRTKWRLNCAPSYVQTRPEGRRSVPRCAHLGAAPLTCAEGRTRAATLLIAFRPTRAGVAPLAVRQGEVSDLAPAHFQGGGDRLEVRGLGRVLVGTPHSMQKSVERSLLNVPSPEPTDLFYLSSPHNPRQIKKITCVEGPCAHCAARACTAQSPARPSAAFGASCSHAWGRWPFQGSRARQGEGKNSLWAPLQGHLKGGGT